MGLIKKTASMLTPARVSRHRRRASQSKAANAQARLADAERKAAEEQAAAIAKTLDEDEAQRKADLDKVATKEAEALPWDPPADS